LQIDGVNENASRDKCYANAVNSISGAGHGPLFVQRPLRDIDTKTRVPHSKFHLIDVLTGGITLAVSAIAVTFFA
jgi:hypothetical protein